MKRTILLLLAACIQLHARAISQITLAENNVSLKKVFQQIEKQTGYHFWYSGNILENTSPVSIDVKNVSLEQALDKCLTNQGLSYSIVDKVVVIKKATNGKEPEPALPLDIAGRVTNEKAEPIIGATVTEKGSSKATATDANGNFRLTGIREEGSLIISSIGYEKVEIKINARKQIDVVLRMTVNTLDETVVIAYGTTTRRLNTGSVSRVTAAEIENQPVSNPLAALQGRVPGLIITQTSGVAGAQFNVEIRGRSSLDASLSRNDPLFVIDGVPFEPGNQPAGQLISAANNPTSATQGGLSPLNTINPADIESIEVLKDADATAIYGSRGANGVILITTKKARQGKTRIDANVYRGISTPTRTMEMLNTKQYVQMRREAFVNDNRIPTPSNAFDILLWDTTRYTDLQENIVMNTAHNTNANLSISGGSANTKFIFGMGLNQQKNGFSPDTKDERVSMHFNISHSTPSNKLNLVLTGLYSSGKNQLISADITRHQNLPPNIKLYDSLGNLNWSDAGVDFFSVSLNNPFASLLRKNKAELENLSGNLKINYRILPNLSFNTSVGYNLFRSNELSISPKKSLPPTSPGLATSSFANSGSKSWIVEPQLEYSEKINKGKLTALLGATWQQQLANTESIQALNYTNDLLLASMAAAGDLFVSNDYQQYRYNAIFGRLNYNFSDKYILNVSGRRDGSSRFGPGKRITNFGAIGYAWIFTNEKFISRSIPFLSFGKLRGSYGTTGNDQIGNYKFLDLWNVSTDTYQGNPGFFPNTLFNPDYNWEKTNKLEFGLELGFLKDRILFTSAFYINRCSNQLVSYILPIQTGFTSVTKNLPALVENKGLELSLTSRNIRSAAFSWTTSFNVTIPRSKLISFPGLENSSYASIYQIGKPLGIVWAYKYLGVDPLTGLYMVEDRDKNGSYNSQDKQFVKTTDPKFYGGLQNNFSFKNIELSVFFEFRKAVGKTYRASLSNPGIILNQPAIVLNRWQKPGDITEIQRFASSTGGVPGLAVSRFNQSDGIYGDASYARLKNISLSYAFGPRLLQKTKMEAVRFFFNAQNVLVITNYLGSDPETQDFNRLPPMRTLVAGIQVTL
jgi:TonB-linked SusC/RagA family outer membrane protein